MKRLILPILSVWTLSLGSNSVFAVNGKITVNGAVTDGTCTIQPQLGVGSGIKDIIIPLKAITKSSFTPTNTSQGSTNFFLFLVNGTGAYCDVAHNKSFKGIHLAPISATDLDAMDKTLLVNKATGASGASVKNPVFIQMFADHRNVVDFTAPWGVQAKSMIYGDKEDFSFVSYQVEYVSKTGIVDAQNVTATVNYNIHYN